MGVGGSRLRPQERKSLINNAPLASRLRAEAAEWEQTEDIPPLLIEAAEAIEALAARVATLEWERRRA